MKNLHEQTKINVEENFRLERYPSSWIKIYFKTYPRFKKIKLLVPKKRSNSLYSTILTRKSRRKFNNAEISKKELSEVLFYSAGILNRQKTKSLDDTRRAYPSAGGRYPPEIYLSINGLKWIASGIYHYNVIEHSLELMILGDQRKRLNKFVYQEMVLKAPITFIISGVLNRTQVKYGPRGYRYVLLDIGHLAQNLYLVATNLKIGCCTIGGFSDDKINNYLDLNENEQVIYMGVLGKYGEN
jgi:SagB-type dehydrogenase family enzyme